MSGQKLGRKLGHLVKSYNHGLEGSGEQLQGHHGPLVEVMPLSLLCKSFDILQYHLLLKRFTSKLNVLTTSRVNPYNQGQVTVKVF